MGFKERMQGDPDEWYYTTAWGLLKQYCFFEKLKNKVSDDFINKTLAALEVIRTNRPEYRKVFIKGVDDVDGGVFSENRTK